MATEPTRIRLGARTTVTAEEYRRLRDALGRGMNRQQLRSWSRANLGRGLSNAAIADLRAQRVTQQRTRERFERTARGSTPRGVVEVPSTGPKGFEVTGIVRIRTAAGVVLERRILYRTPVLGSRANIMTRLQSIAERIAAGDVDSSGAILSIQLVSITRYI